jgi:GNAT superfamily N-acetyltransferase
VSSETLDKSSHPACLIGTIPGVTFRTYAGSDDDIGIVALINACARADAIEANETVTAFAGMIANATSMHCVPERDLLVGFADGAIVAFCRQARREQDDGMRRLTGMVYVHPEWRRCGIGRAMLRWHETHAISLAENLPRARTLF